MTTLLHAQAALSPESKLDCDALGQSISGFLGFLCASNQLACVESNADPAAGALDPIIRFKPSDSLTHFVAALRALKFDGLVVE
jgi:hypothetical protein